jgi:hypothetical protein
MPGLPAIHDAARKGDLGRVQRLLDKDPAAVHAQTGYGGTALIDAAARGHVEVVRYMLLKGADLNHRNLHGWTVRVRPSGTWGDRKRRFGFGATHAPPRPRGRWTLPFGMLATHLGPC